MCEWFDETCGTLMDGLDRRGLTDNTIIIYICDNEDHGTNASVITPSLADEATRAAALLAPFGISLLEAARMAVISKNAELASSSIEDALTSFRKSKSNRSDAHAVGGDLEVR